MGLRKGRLRPQPEDFDGWQDEDGCPEAAYAFVAPPGLSYGEAADVLLRVDPGREPDQAAEQMRQRVEQARKQAPAGTLPPLRGAVDSASGLWAPCMEAELRKTTVEPTLRAADLDPPSEQARLEITPTGESSGQPPSRRLALDTPAEWRWQVRGARAGRAQVVLRLYALESAPDGQRLSRLRRVQTFQHRMVVEVSAARWVENELPPPWLWSLALMPLAAAIGWLKRTFALAWRRRTAQR